jgi:pyruvate dehydrogenase E2 component (dihydrolipoamide acetyltransferase)
MISRVVLAKLSPTMEEGTIVKWHKSEGDAVRVGDVLAEIETDKANMEMEALGDGVLRRILVAAGSRAPVGALIGIVADPDDDITAVSEVQAAPSGTSPAAAAELTPTHAAATAPTAASPTSVGLAPEITPGAELPLSEMRRVIARRLSESFFTAPHFFVTIETEMDAAMALRDQVARARNVKISINDLVVKACAQALRAFPMVNARFAGDRIVTLADVHIGLAVALPDGLIVPVIRNADRKDLVALARESKDLATRARERKLKPEDYTGSTFTVSNLGMLGVTQFTAIINPPESAILAVGAVRLVPIVEGERIRPGQRMNLTLSCDHRAIDGALAAQFLQSIRKSLENPVVLFMD